MCVRACAYKVHTRGAYVVITPIRARCNFIVSSSLLVSTGNDRPKCSACTGVLTCYVLTRYGRTVFTDYPSFLCAQESVFVRGKRGPEMNPLPLWELKEKKNQVRSNYKLTNEIKWMLIKKLFRSWSRAKPQIGRSNKYATVNTYSPMK